MAILASKMGKIQSITGLLNISASGVYETTLRAQFNWGKIGDILILAGLLHQSHPTRDCCYRVLPVITRACLANLGILQSNLPPTDTGPSIPGRQI